MEPAFQVKILHNKTKKQHQMQKTVIPQQPSPYVFGRTNNSIAVGIEQMDIMIQIKERINEKCSLGQTVRSFLTEGKSSFFIIRYIKQIWAKDKKMVQEMLGEHLTNRVAAIVL